MTTALCKAKLHPASYGKAQVNGSVDKSPKVPDKHVPVEKKQSQFGATTAGCI